MPVWAAGQRAKWECACEGDVVEVFSPNARDYINPRILPRRSLNGNEPPHMFVAHTLLTIIVIFVRVFLAKEKLATKGQR